MDIISGVYSIHSIIKPERVYVGSAKNIYDRWRRHRGLLKNNKHHSAKLQRHVDKYGEGDLVFSIIEICDISEIRNREGYYISMLSYMDTKKPYFNSNIDPISPLGVSLSEDHKKKISEANKGKRFSLGYKHTPEARKKISDALRLRPVKEETKQKLREKNKGQANWNKGGSISEETKRKISEANTGRVVSDETREKLSILNKGKKVSDETKDKISKALKGRTISNDQRQKMSIANKGKVAWSKGVKLGKRPSVSGENNPMFGVPCPNKGKKLVYDDLLGRKRYV